MPHSTRELQEAAARLRTAAIERLKRVEAGTQRERTDAQVLYSQTLDVCQRVERLAELFDDRVRL